MADNRQRQPLSNALLRTVWLFQAIVAGPTFVILGLLVFIALYDQYIDVYYFVTHLCTAIFAGAIIFIVVVQRKIPYEVSNPRLTLIFEIAKSVFATALWIWLMMDSLFGPHRRYRGSYTKPLITASAISSLLLL
jgi:hypothetical protein